MGRVQVVLDDKLEAEVRKHTRKKGDISKFINEALHEWLKKNDKQYREAHI